MTEYGVFNDEGCIERDLWSQEEAQRALAYHYTEGERGLTIDALCDEHEEQAYHTCEFCYAEVES